MRKIIETKNLQANDLPRRHANWDRFSEFALTFDPTVELENGKFPFSTYSIEQTPTENSTILEIRLYLYAQQRWWNNRADDIDDESFAQIHQIIELLRNKLQTK
jgi:hypothetical protein